MRGHKSYGVSRTQCVAAGLEQARDGYLRPEEDESRIVLQDNVQISPPTEGFFFPSTSRTLGSSRPRRLVQS
jgi:hypothetical protein